MRARGPRQDPLCASCRPEVTQPLHFECQAHEGTLTRGHSRGDTHEGTLTRGHSGRTLSRLGKRHSRLPIASLIQPWDASDNDAVPNVVGGVGGSLAVHASQCGVATLCLLQHKGATPALWFSNLPIPYQRTGWDSNPRGLAPTRFPIVRLKPLGHPSRINRKIRSCPTIHGSADAVPCAFRLSGLRLPVPPSPSGRLRSGPPPTR